MGLSILIPTALACAGAATIESAPAPIRFAIVGLVHDQARGFTPTANLANEQASLLCIGRTHRS
jgi:hypothetical protein